MDINQRGTRPKAGTNSSITKTVPAATSKKQGPDKVIIVAKLNIDNTRWVEDNFDE